MHSEQAPSKFSRGLVTKADMVIQKFPYRFDGSGKAKTNLKKKKDGELMLSIAIKMTSIVIRMMSHCWAKARKQRPETGILL